MIIHFQSSELRVPPNKDNLLYDFVKNNLKQITHDKHFILFKIQNNSLVLIHSEEVQGSQLSQHIYLLTEDVFHQNSQQKLPKDYNKLQQSMSWQSLQNQNQNNFQSSSGSIIELHQHKDAKTSLKPLQNQFNILQQKNSFLQKNQQQTEFLGKSKASEIASQSAIRVQNSPLNQIQGKGQNKKIRKKQIHFQNSKSKYQVEVKKGLNLDVKCRDNDVIKWVICFSNSGHRDWPNNRIGIYEKQTTTRLVSIPYIPSQSDFETTIQYRVGMKLGILQLQFGYQSHSGSLIYFGPILRSLIESQSHELNRQL